MDALLVVAGILAILAAAIHGGAGEALVVRRLSTGALSPSPFGGPRMTMAMIHVAWHIGTIAFLAFGVALVLSGTVLNDDEARAIAVVAASAFTGFAALAVGAGFAHTRSLRPFVRHPGPLALASVAALAWLGAF